MWDYVTPYFPSRISKSTSGNNTQSHSLKNTIVDHEIDFYRRDIDRKSSSDSNCSISSNLTTTLYCSQSSLSSENENSYIELIRDYRSGDKINFNLKNSPKRIYNNNNNYYCLSTENIPANNLYEKILNCSKSESALNVCDDELAHKLSSDFSLFNLVAERLETGKTCSELIEKWKNNEDLVKCDISNICNNKTEIILANSKNDLSISKELIHDKTNVPIPSMSSSSKYNDIPDVQIDNLVENAKKLLQSVDETLSKSDSIVSRLDSSIKVDIIDDLIKNSDYLSNDDIELNKKFLNKTSVKNLAYKNNSLLKTENLIGSNSSTPDSKISKSPAHSICQYDTSKLHPPSPYSRVSRFSLSHSSYYCIFF